MYLIYLLSVNNKIYMCEAEAVAVLLFWENKSN